MFGPTAEPAKVPEGTSENRNKRWLGRCSDELVNELNEERNKSCLGREALTLGD